MKKITKKSRAWVKPQIARLGDLRDVAGPNATAAQSPVQTRS
jgi:hypothetical protein